MTRRQLKIHRLTRDRRFVVLGALALAGTLGLIGLAVGWGREPVAMPRVVPGDGPGRFAVEPTIAIELDADGLAEFIRRSAADGDTPLDARRREVDGLIARARLPPDTAARLGLLADGLMGAAPAQDEAIRALRKAASGTPPRRFDQEWLADVLSARQEFDDASAHYEGEGRAFPDAGRARTRALEIAFNRDDIGRLRRLLADREMTKDVPVHEVSRAQARCGNYAGVLASTLRAQGELCTSWLHVAIALLAGALWWLIFARIAGMPPRRWWLALPALVLGAFSTTLTLAAQIVFPMRFDENGDFLDRAGHFIVDVGLREETFKLVCAVPLIVLLRRESAAHVVLVVLSAVGLGFAIEENIGYFAAGPGPAWSRFLTANLLHLAWTGMVGFSLWRACLGVPRGWEHFLSTFLLAVLSHGAYDLCFGVLGGEDLSILSILVFVAIAFRYFTQLRSVSEPSRQIVSPLAVFVFGSAFMLGMTFAGLCAAVGLRWAGPFFLNDALALAPMAFLFIREFRDD